MKIKNEKVYIEGYIVGVFTNTLEKIGNKIQLANGDIVDIDNRFVHKFIKPEKVKVPQFVANWIANVKRNGFKFRNSSRFHEEIVSSDDVYRVMYYILREGIAGEAIRIWVNANRDAFARAWLDGYEVEKEKRYLVKVKGVNDFGCYLNKGLLSKEYFWESKAEIGGCRTKHTRKQLEEDGFGWVFDCEGIEIEEVEE